MEDYSVIIRTTGNAGEKYKKLLESINNLEPQPKEIIVVLPEGYDLPKDKLGTEIFYFCPKGMVIQRLTGIEKCKTKYALISDDDIAFDSDFVKKLYEPLKDEKYFVSAGPLLNFFPPEGKSTLITTIMGSATPTIRNKNRYNTVLKSTGYSFNRINTTEHKLYETQSAAWTCFFMNIEAFRDVHFEDEMWLDKFGYSAHDDTCMFYKCWLLGKTPVIVSDAVYQHLDAGTSKKGNSLKVDKATSFNTYVFWHRFIYSQQKSLFGKLWSIICINHLLFMGFLLDLLKVFLSKNKKSLKAKKQGLIEAKRWIKSEEYKNIPPVRR